MKALLIGIGAAGNKAVLEAVNSGVMDLDDTMIINSTSKDFPEQYKGERIILSPNDAGCGKQRKNATDFVFTAIRSGKLNNDKFNEYNTIFICTSVEGGTGSGATPVIAKFFNQALRKNVHVFAFTGFEDDARGLGNTVEFFQELDSNIALETIRNVAFQAEARGNKFKAEELANKEMCRRIEILTGKNFIASKQNIDDTDIMKVSNTTGYCVVEKAYIEKPLTDQEDFNKLIRQMSFASKSVKVEEPSAIRLGVILNIAPSSEDAIDYTFSTLKELYGNPYESYMQTQWDGKKEYVAFIASGMRMPKEEIIAIYERYNEGRSKLTKEQDTFFSEIKKFNIGNPDFDMGKDDKPGLSMDDFLNQFGSK